MVILRSLQNMHSLVLLGGLLLCLILMVQVKQIYDNNQKYNRYLGYKKYLEEISAEMNVVERSANKSSVYVHQLNEALLKRDKEIKNVSLPRMTLPS